MKGRIMKRRVKITLTNDFHNTEANVLAERLSNGNLSININQYKRACRKLCGMNDCMCGDIRGPITDQSGNKYGIDYCTDGITGTLDFIKDARYDQMD